MEGALGDGAEKWQLSVESEQSLVVMSLLSNPTGHLTNLSTTPRAAMLDMERASHVERHSNLVVATPAVSNANLETEGSFTLSTTVSNAGDGDSTATTLRYYRSTDATVTSADTQIGTDTVGALSAGGASAESISLTAPATAGTVYYGACVDSVTDESDTTDNCSASVRVEVEIREPSTFPDLELGAATVNDSRPETGASFTLSATVRNAGDTDAAATTLSYYRSTDAAISTADAVVGTDAVAELAASASSDESVTLSAPTDPGSYYYGACVDAVAGESNTANNCSAAARVTVPQPPRPPDLMVDAPAVNDSTPEAGAEFTLSATVRNQGDGGAAATTLRYFRSADDGISRADVQVGTDALAELGASASSDESVTLSPPSDPGWYYYGACVDAVADEFYKGNNCSSSVPVRFPEPTTFPDLVVDTLTVSESAPDASAPFTLSATVRNRGDADAGATTLRYYRSEDATITTADTLVDTDAVGGLAASGTGGESARLIAPSDPGAYYYGACVDAVAGESDATNNCSAAVPVTVPEPAADPDLVVDAPPLSDGNAGGGEFTISVTVRNRGGRASTATSLVFYRSRDAHISTEDIEVVGAGVPGLGALGTRAYSVVRLRPLDTGAHYYGACVGLVAGESDTANNCSAATVLNRPELRAASVSFDDSVIDKGADVGLHSGVGNVGTARSASTTLHFYHSADAAISTSDTEVATMAVPKLDIPGIFTAGGQGNGMTGRLTVTGPLDVGIHYYGACVDAVPGEADTTNNCSESRALEVR